MNTTTSPEEIGKRVRADIEQISTITTVAKSTGIAVPTLRRHLLHKPEQLTIGELCAVAALLRRDPRDYFDGEVAK